jgi:hypothetical protein
MTGIQINDFADAADAPIVAALGFECEGEV